MPESTTPLEELQENRGPVTISAGELVDGRFQIVYRGPEAVVLTSAPDSKHDLTLLVKPSAKGNEEVYALGKRYGSTYVGNLNWVRDAP